MDVDHFMDRQRWIDAVERSVDKGVTERPPVAGVSYAAFAVHPPEPGNLLALAIAHRGGEKYIVDVVKDDISVVDAAAVLHSYGVTQVTGDVGDEADALAHAVAGVVNLLATELVAGRRSGKSQP
jgi:hypothetical protein